MMISDRAVALHHGERLVLASSTATEGMEFYTVCSKMHRIACFMRWRTIALIT
jgi:hypothetical protein